MGNSILNNQINNPTGVQNLGNVLNPEMLQQFNQFKNSFQGNPKNAVMNMLQRGVMSNEQFSQLSQMAKQLQNFMH